MENSSLKQEQHTENSAVKEKMSTVVDHVISCEEMQMVLKTKEMLESISKARQRDPSSVSIRISHYRSQSHPCLSVGGQEQMRNQRGGGRGLFVCDAKDAKDVFNYAYRCSQHKKKVANALNSVTKLLLVNVDVATLSKLDICTVFSNIVHVAMHECPIPPDLSNLVHVENLKHLECQSCESFESLSLTHMPSLESLSLRSKSPWSLPRTIDRLVNLRDLTIHNSSDRGDQMKRIGRLKNLRALKVSGCDSLDVLPPELGDLINLEELKVLWCTNLRTLPKQISQLSKLKKLEVVYCPSLHSLPEEVSNLTDLEHLEVSSCPLLQNLPQRLGKLRRLKILDLEQLSEQVHPMSPINIGRLPEDCILKVDFLPLGLEDVVCKSSINIREYNMYGKKLITEDLTVSHLDPYFVPYFNVIDRCATGMTKLQLLLRRAKERLYFPGGPGYLRAKAEYEGISAEHE